MLIICRRYRTSFSAYLEGEIDTRLSQSLEEHLDDCPECAVVLETFRKTIALCQDLPLLPVPNELHSRIMQLLESEFQPELPIMHLTIRRRVTRKGKGNKDKKVKAKVKK
ncbi:MAG: zf-HC2 domain-containing protein [Candidatus Omnitrophota bacterium]